MSTSKLRSADVFRRFDQDGDGRLSQEEFAYGIEVLKLEMRYEDAVTLFERFKPKGSKFLCLRDFTQLVQYKHASDLPTVPPDSSGVAPVTADSLRSVGQSLNLADLSVNGKEGKEGSAVERARAALQQSRKQSVPAARSSRGAELLASSQPISTVSLELSTLSTDGQERLLETLVGKDATLLEQQKREKSKLVHAETTREELTGRIATIEAKKRDMAGKFGSEAAKIKQSCVYMLSKDDRDLIP